MRCKCCDAMLPSVRQFKKVTIVHPDDSTKVKIVTLDGKNKNFPIVEEDFCSKCINFSNPDFIPTEDDFDISDLGIDFSSY